MTTTEGPPRAAGWRWSAALAAALLWLAGVVLAAPVAHAEDGYALWLRYRPLPQAQAEEYRAAATELVAPATTFDEAGVPTTSAPSRLTAADDTGAARAT